MEAPKAVIKAASGYLKDVPKSKLVYLGKYTGADAFYVKMPDNVKAGYPPVYLFKNAVVRPIYGEQALDIISSLS